jgi:hypothetical protein
MPSRPPDLRTACGRIWNDPAIRIWTEDRTADHLNDWLTFLPDDPLTRASLACGFIAGAFTLSLVVSVLGVEWAKWQADRTLEQSSRIRTLDSFHRI